MIADGINTVEGGVKCDGGQVKKGSALGSGLCLKTGGVKQGVECLGLCLLQC